MTPEELGKRYKEKFPQYKDFPDVVVGQRAAVIHPEYQSLIASPTPKSFASKIWEALKVPEQMSRSGLTQLAGMVPQPESTGNLATDILKGTPRIAANTLAEAAPGFISRGALTTAGLSKGLQTAMPLVSAVGEGLGKQVESVSGAVPGALKAAFRDPLIMFAKGKKAAGPLYEAAKAEMNPAESIFKGMYKPQEIVDTAKEYLSKGGQLEPAESLMYRKALDKLLSMKNVIKDELIPMRSAADTAAKASEKIAAADPMHRRGLIAESLRNLIPQNKGGGASTFKLGIMTALEHMGLPGKLGLAAMSPAAVGAASSLAGTVEPIMTNPRAMTSLQQLYEALKNRGENR